MHVPRNRFARTLVMLVVLPAAAGGLLGLGLWAIGFADSDGSSTRLTAISIPHQACPYLEAVHSANIDLWDTRDLASAGRGNARRQFLAKIDPLVLSLRVAASQVPRPLRVRLTQAAEEVEVVRRSWSKPNGDADAFSSLLAYGSTLEDAGDLVGDECGFAL